MSSDIVEYLMMRRADGALFNPSGPTAADTITTLRAEVERLGKKLNVARYGEPDFAWSIYEAQMVDLRATNERLRAALVTLSKYQADEDEMDWAETVLAMNKIARAALAEEKHDD